MKRKRPPNAGLLFHLVTVPVARKAMALFLASGLMLAASCAGIQAQMLDIGKASSSRPVRGQVAISRDVNVSSSNDKISLNLRDANLRDVLNMLAESGHFNLILDQSVTGTLSVDVKDISVNKALEYIFTVADLNYTRDGNTVIVATKAAADQRNMNAKTFKAIPVLYKDATTIAKQLNDTLLKVPRNGGSTTALAAADPDSNSLLIMGTDVDIKLVGDALRELDMPRNRKVYHIQHNTPKYVAQVISANFFRNGENAAGTTAAAATTATAGLDGIASFTAGGVTFIPESVSSTLTVLATDEQLALVDSIIDQVDVRRPQVAIEVSLVEIQNTDLKTFIPDWSTFNFGRLAGLDVLGNNTAISQFIFANPFAKQSHKLPRPDSAVAGANFSFSNQSLKGKVLANPTVVAMDGTASSINITDQVPTIAQSNTIVNGVQTITSTITTQTAGVQMTMTPTIFNDGTVMLNLAPQVSQPIRTVEATTGTPPNQTVTSTVLLATRSLTLAGVRVKDGETLVIGGLLRETSQTDIRKVPGLNKLPIVGAMFRSTNGNSKEKTELVLMVTPHILKDDGVTYFNTAGGSGGKYQNHNQGIPGQNGIQPVGLPKFIGALQEKDLQVAPGQPGTVTPAPSIPVQGDKIEPDSQPGTDLKKSMLAPSEDVMPLRPGTTLTGSEAAFRLPPVKAGQKTKPAESRVRRAGTASARSVSASKEAVSLQALDEVLKN